MTAVDERDNSHSMLIAACCAAAFGGIIAAASIYKFRKKAPESDLIPREVAEVLEDINHKLEQIQQTQQGSAVNMAVSHQ